MRNRISTCQACTKFFTDIYLLVALIAYTDAPIITTMTMTTDGQTIVLPLVHARGGIYTSSRTQGISDYNFQTNFEDTNFWLHL